MAKSRNNGTGTVSDAPRIWRRWWVLGGFVLVLVALSWWLLDNRRRHETAPGVASSPGPAPPAIPALAADDPAFEPQLQMSCRRCHGFPEPDILPRSAWRESIEAMYKAVGAAGQPLDGLRAKDVIAWYERRAPEEIEFRDVAAESGDGPLRFRRFAWRPDGAPDTPAVANIQLHRAGPGGAYFALLCDMRHHVVMKMEFPPPGVDDFWQKVPRAFKLADVPHPCRVEVADLDGDGQRDILVADLGSFAPKDHHLGAVVLLRAEPDGSLGKHVIADGLGRVADARAADLDGDGDLDVVAGVFGWHNTGELIWLENQGRSGSGGSLPVFAKHLIATRTGVVHNPITDIDSDGRPDILALFSQEHEQLIQFRNLGGRFEERLLHQAPHPAWGSNGLELADMDLDGDLDALICNGDSLDDLLMKNYQGIRWIENRGSEPWREHVVGPLYAAHGAKAVDLDGDGDLDVVAAVFLPQFDPYEDLPDYDLPSLVWFEQHRPGEFRQWVIERRLPFHPTLDAADLDDDGDVDLVVGSYTMALLEGGRGVRLPRWVDTWENLQQ